MSRRRWIVRYFKTVLTQSVCEACGNKFEYERVTKPKRYCGRFCAHEVQLKQMRICNEFIRQLGRTA